jgi:hypothetical protein
MAVRYCQSSGFRRGDDWSAYTGSDGCSADSDADQVQPFLDSKQATSKNKLGHRVLCGSSGLTVSILLLVLAGSLAAMLLCASYWHWRVYSLYKSLGEVGRRFAYSEFAFQFQSSWLARQLGGQMFRDALSPEQQMQVAAVDQQMRRVMGVFAICGAICAFAFSWALIRRGA